jgi:hypothetical protein
MVEVERPQVEGPCVMKIGEIGDPDHAPFVLWLTFWFERSERDGWMSRRLGLCDVYVVGYSPCLFVLSSPQSPGHLVSCRGIMLSRLGGLDLHHRHLHHEQPSQPRTRVEWCQCCTMPTLVPSCTLPRRLVFVPHQRRTPIQAFSFASETVPLPTKKPTDDHMGEYPTLIRPSPERARDHFLDDAWSMKSHPFNLGRSGSSWTALGRRPAARRAGLEGRSGFMG